MNCNIDGIIIKELKRFTDDRGWLMELFRQDEIDDSCRPAMAYVSMTRSGVTRGPHEHVDQTDYFCFLGPSTFRLYLWDNRKGSPTYGQTYKIDLGVDRPALAIVPPGVVHAYRNVGDADGLVYNAPNRLYAGRGRKEPVDEIRHEENENSRFRLDD